MGGAGGVAPGGGAAATVDPRPGAGAVRPSAELTSSETRPVQYGGRALATLRKGEKPTLFAAAALRIDESSATAVLALVSVAALIAFAYRGPPAPPGAAPQPRDRKRVPA